MISSASRSISATLSSVRSLLLEHLLAVLFSELYSVVLTFALEFISVVTSSEIKGLLDPLLCMVHMLLLFLVSVLMAATQLETFGDSETL